MSFGYSVGDFIAVVQLAYKIWDGCKSSPDQYRDIGRDVGNTHLVLSAIERYWKAEEVRGRKLIGAQEEDLHQLASGSEEVLKKLEEKLDKHKKLGDRGNFADKLKWAISSFAKDIGPLRQQLQDNTQALAIFNATLTAENASERSDDQMKLLQTQGRLLEYLVTRYWEFQTGTGKIEPAFSQVAFKDISEDEAPSWAVIDADLRKEGFEPQIVRGNREFIRNWIRIVIPEEEEVQEADTTELAQPIASSAGKQEANDKCEFKVDEQPEPVASNTPLVEPPRSVSPSSHRSQSSTWRDVTTDDAKLPAKLLAKVFRSKYGEDCDELYLAPIRRAFHQIDWTDRGWLPRTDVERYCKEAGNLAKFKLDDEMLSRVVKLMDKDADHEVNPQELNETVMTIRSMLLDMIIGKSIEWGRVFAGFQLKDFFDGRSDNSRLPLHWKRHADKTPGGRYWHELKYEPQILPPLERNFTNAGFIASSYCAREISNAVSTWRNTLTGMPRTEAEEYTVALNDVLRATAKFHLFDTDQFNNYLHDLDRLQSQVDLLPVEAYPALEFANYPEEILRNLLTQSWDILDSILGFVYDLKSEDAKKTKPTLSQTASFDIENIPPPLAEWRRLRMLERSRKVYHCVSQWDEMNKSAVICQDWWNHHSKTVSQRIEEVLISTTAIRDTQKQTFIKESPNTIQIREIMLDKLTRHGYRTPHTVYKVMIDGQHVCTSEPQKSLTPFGYVGIECRVHGESLIRVEFYSSKDSTGGSLSNSNFIGAYEFKVETITNFSGYSLVTKYGPLIESSSLQPKIPNVSIAVSTKWKTANVIGKLPRGWEARLNDDGRMYYVDHNAHSTTFKKPSTITGVDDLESLASAVVALPLPSQWEARRSGNDSVYFHNVKNGQSTARLWYDPLPASFRSPTTLTPLPRGWQQGVADGKLFFKLVDGESSHNRPPYDEKSIFEGVIRPKTFSQVDEFFPEALIALYENAKS